MTTLILKKKEKKEEKRRNKKKKTTNLGAYSAHISTALARPRPRQTPCC